MQKGFFQVTPNFSFKGENKYSLSSDCKNFQELAFENVLVNWLKHITNKVQYLKIYGQDHVQVFWKRMCFGNISQLETKPLIG